MMKKPDFFACWYKFIEIKSWLKNTGVDVVINGCAHSGRRALKLAVSHEEVNGITWFLVCWYKFRKAYKVALIIWPPTDGALFSRKFIFAQIFGFFEKFCHVSFSWRQSKMKTNIAIDISPTYSAKFGYSSYGPKCCQPINLQDSLKCNILRKKWMMKFIFCM